MTLVTALPIIWLAVILAAIFFEALTEKLIAVWCAPAAAVTFLCGLFKMEPICQLALFILLSFALIAASQAVCAAVRRAGKNKKSGADIE